jgi:putative ABC transport system permease protein
MLIEGIAAVIPQGEDLPFAAPTVNPIVALGALGILMIGGVIAGILPARKAASINPIEAIRSE